MDDSSNPPLKQCSKCKELFPATTEHFSRRPDRGSGIRSQCRTCSNANLRMRYAQQHPKDVPDGYKRCTVCKEVKPVTNEFFSIRLSGKPWGPCKTCTAAERKLRAESIREHGRKYYQEHKEEHLLRGQRYYQQHKEHKQQASKQYYISNRDYYIAKGAKRRVLRRNVDGDYTVQQIQEQLKRQKYKCYYAACGHAKFEKREGKYIYHIDHTYPLSRVVGTDIPANDISYLVLACPACNQSKGDKFPWEWTNGGRLL